MMTRRYGRNDRSKTPGGLRTFRPMERPGTLTMLIARNLPDSVTQSTAICPTEVAGMNDEASGEPTPENRQKTAHDDQTDKAKPASVSIRLWQGNL